MQLNTILQIELAIQILELAVNSAFAFVARCDVWPRGSPVWPAMSALCCGQVKFPRVTKRDYYVKVVLVIRKGRMQTGIIGRDDCNGFVKIKPLSALYFKRKNNKFNLLRRIFFNLD